jgi:hypothetical protein
MKFRAHPPQRIYNVGEWQPWFAWRPVKINLSEPLTPPKFKPAYQYVWLEYVESRQEFTHGRWYYRNLIPANEYRYPSQPKEGAEDGSTEGS